MFRKRSRAACGLAQLAAAMLLLAGPGAAGAEEAGSAAEAAAVTDPMERAIQIAVDAQPLGESLRSLAKQANLQILFDSAIVTGKSGRALKGVQSARKALSDLLRGTGLEALEQAPGVVVIRRRAAGRDQFE